MVVRPSIILPDPDPASEIAPDPAVEDTAFDD
jgi:hypothetical protein